MRNKGSSGVIQLIVVAGITIVILGFFWMVATAPVSFLTAQAIRSGWSDSDMMGVVTFLDVFIKVLPLCIGLGVIAWGWVRTVEERETGFSSI